MPDTELKTFKVGDEIYDIKPSEVKDFLKDFPDAEEHVSYTAGKDTFDIKPSDVPDFLKDYPEATPTFKKKSGYSISSKDASIPPLGQKPKTSESVTPSTSKPTKPETGEVTGEGAYQITTPDSVASGETLTTAQTAEEKKRQQALADQQERERLQAKYKQTVYDFEKQKPKKIASQIENTEFVGAPVVPESMDFKFGSSWYDNKYRGTMFDADFSEYLNRTNQFKAQIGLLTNQKVSSELDLWLKTELPEVLKQDKEYQQINAKLSQAQAMLQQQVASGAMPIDAAKKALQALQAEANPQIQSIAARYMKVREDKAKEDFQKMYSEELVRSATKIKGQEYYKNLTEIIKSQAFKGLSIDDQKRWVKETWLNELSKNPDMSEGDKNLAYDEFMRNMVRALSYDEKGNLTTFAIKETANNLLPKLTADYQNYIASHPNRYGAGSLSPSTVKTGDVPQTDPIVEHYQKAMKMLQDVVDSPDETKELGFMNNLKAANLEMLWDGMKSAPPMPFVRPLDELLTSTMISAIAKGDPEKWTDSEKAMMDAAAIKETFDKTYFSNPAYGIGKGLSGSLEYVGEFVATGGVYSGIGGATERAALKMLKVPTRTLEKGVVTAAENLTKAQATRYWTVGRPLKFLLGSAAQTAANPQRYLNGIVQRMSPGLQLSLSEDGDELVAALDKNYLTSEGFRTGHNQGALEAVGRSFGETWSEMGTERMGGGVEWLGSQMAKGVLKGVKSVDLLKRLYIGYYMSKFGLTKTAMARKIISDKLGWHGFVPEMAEEIMNMPLQNIFTGESPISEGLVKDTGEIDWDNLLETASVVALQSPIMNTPHMVAGTLGYFGDAIRDPMLMSMYDENGLARKVEITPEVSQIIYNARNMDFDELVKLKEEGLPKMKLKPEEKEAANALIDAIITEATDPKAFDETIAEAEKIVNNPETSEGKKEVYQHVLDKMRKKKKDAEEKGEERKAKLIDSNSQKKMLRDYDASVKNELQKAFNLSRQPDIEDEENAGDFDKAQKVSDKIANAEQLNPEEQAIANTYPKLIQALTDIESEKKTLESLEKMKSGFNQGEYDKKYEQRKQQLLGTIEKPTELTEEQKKAKLKWLGKHLRFNPTMLDAFLSLTPKGLQPEAMRQIAGEFGIEGPVDSVAEFLMRLNETLILGEKEEAEKEMIPLSSVPNINRVSRLNNKPVVYKKRRGILSIDKGGKVTIETANKIYELEATPESDADQLGIEEMKVVDDFEVTEVSEESATINGNTYKIQTDKKGNITRLVGKDTKDITDEDMLIEVEVKRNKLPLPPIVKQKIESQPEQVIEAIAEAVGMTPLEINAIERMMEFNMNDSVAAALDRMLEGETLEDADYFKVSLWAEDLVNRLEKAKTDMPNAVEYLEELINGVYNILNEIPNEAIKDKPTEKGSNEANDESAESEAEDSGSEDDGEGELETSGIYGKAGTAQVTATTDTKFKYKLVEADDLEPSHLSGGERNPNHTISNAQPKERNDQGSAKAQQSISENPDIARLGANENIFFGAPVVNARNEVIQGNNRSIALKRHYRISLPNRNSVIGEYKYKTDLAAVAEQFGFTSEQVLSMKKPILVREVDVTDDEAVVMGQADVKDLESGGKQRIDPITLSRKISNKDKAKIASLVFVEGATVNKALRDNIDVVGPIINAYLNPAQIETAYNKNGELTDKGASDLTEAINHFLFVGGAAVLPAAFEEIASANARLGLLKALPAIFSVSEENSLLPDIQNAILALYGFEMSKQEYFDDWANTEDMFKGGRPADAFTRTQLAIAKALGNAKTQVEVKNLFAKYAELVNGKKPEDMFTPDEIPPISKQDAINQLFFKTKPNGKDKGNDAKGDKNDRKPDQPEEKKPAKGRDEIIKAKRKIRDEALDKELGDALDDLLNIGISDSPEKQIERFEKSNKILVIYFKKGIFKISDILEDIMLKLGDKLDQFFFDAIKKAYFAYQAEATDEELDQMTTPREGKAVTYETIKNKIEDEINSELESLEPQSGPGDKGGEAGNNEDAELPPNTGGQGSMDAGGDGKTPEGGSKGGRGSGASVGGVRQPSIVGNYTLGETAKSPETFNVAERYEDNINALSLLLELIRGRSQATKAQQAKLAKYVGYGGLKEILLNPDSDEGWTASTVKHKTAVRRTKILVEAIEAELKAQGKAPDFSMWQFLRESTDTSFYTPFDLVHGMYYALDKLGFNHGKLLEPSAGIGNFFIGMPKSVAKNSMLQAVELDFITGNILKQLFPDAATHLESYEHLADNHNNYDVVISNVPFSNRTKIKGVSIHNYFFRQALDNVREGGIIAFVSSTGTMDAMDKTTREYLAENGYFLGAIRVGDKAFKASNTSVTSDIIFIQKKGSNVRKPKIEKAFTETVTRQDENGDDYRINEYFDNNPSSILGTLKPSTFVQSSGMYVESPAGINHEEAIKKWVDANLAKVYDHSMSIQEVNDMELVAAEKEEFQKVNNLYRFPDGNVGQIHGFEDGNPLVMKGKFIRLSKEATKRVPAFIALRKAFNKLVYLEYNGFADDKVNEARAELNREYDKFFSEFGPLSAKDNIWMELDIDGYNVRALENKDNDTGKITKADIFFQRTIKPNKPIDKADTFEEAIMISYAQKATIDTELIESLLGLKKGDWAGIEKRGLVFYDPSLEKWVTRDEYLSGNVKRKLREAKSAHKTNQKFIESGGNFDQAKDLQYGLSTLESNIAALEEIQPPLAPAAGIFTPMGARWIPEKYYEQFFEHIFGQTGKVNYYKSNDKWDVLFTGKAGVKMNSYEVIAPNVFSGQEQRYGSPVSLFEAAMNQLEPTFIDTKRGAAPLKQVNQVATDRGVAVYTRIRKEFQNWIYDNEERREELENLYNEQYNDIALRTYDGSNLQTPGLTHFTLAQHQKDAVWMLLHLRGGIIDHEVGLGKSLVIIAAAMEMRRLGIARKPMAIGLKSQLPGMVDEFRKAYPHAKILSLTNETDFSAKNRKRILSKIASNDWDLVAITHDNFNAISHDKELQIELIQEELDAMETELRKLSGDSKRFERDLNSKISDLRGKLTELANKKTDAEIMTFQQLGIDMLFVDESQKYKNLQFQSKLTNIKGLGTQKGSGRAFNMQIASKSMHKLRGADEGIVFLSGTPISNSLSEMYLLMKYMRPTMLKEKGINTFDTWAALFAEPKREYELYMGKLKEINRFRRFGNAPELLKMYREIADVKNSTNTVIDRPLGIHKLEVVKMTPMQKAWLKELQDFIGDKGRYGGEWISDSPNAQKAYAVLAVTSAKLMSIDMRLVLKEPEILEWMRARGLDPNEIFGYGDKIKKVAENVSEIYNRTSEHKGVQLLFCDIGTPKSKNTVVNLYDMLALTETEENMERIFGKIGEEFENLETKPSLAGVKKNIVEVLGITNEDIDILIAESGKMTFDSYGEIKRQLMEKGIPENQITFIHSWNGTAKRKELYQKVNDGEIRVLIGSTEKMGVGVNVQKRAIAAHHIDIRWTPADLEQRNGRIIRQRNWYAKTHNNNEVEIYYYALDQSLDAYMYNIVATKANWIKQAKTSNMTERYIEDIEDDADMGAMAAMISGNQTLKERIRLERELAQLEEEKIWINSKRMETDAAIKRRKQWIDERIEAIKTQQLYQAFYEGHYPKVEHTTVGEKGMEDLWQWAKNNINETFLRSFPTSAALYETYKKAQQRIKDRQVKEGENDVEVVEDIEKSYQKYRQEESLKDEAKYEVTLITKDGPKAYTTAKEAGEAFFKNGLHRTIGNVGLAYGFQLYVKRNVNNGEFTLETHYHGIPIGQAYALPTIDTQMSMLDEGQGEGQFVQLGKLLRAAVLGIKTNIKKAQSDIDIFTNQIAELEKQDNTFDPEKQALIHEISQRLEEVTEQFRREEAEEAEREEREREERRNRNKKDGENEAAPVNEQEQQSKAIEFLEKLKIDTSGRKTYALPFPPQIWNGFLIAIEAGIKAGEKVAFAINRGIAYLKEQKVKNIADYVKYFSDEQGIPYVPGNPFQPNVDRPIFESEEAAALYLEDQNIAGFEVRFIRGEYTISPVGEKSLAERIDEMGKDATIQELIDKLTPLGYTESEIRVMSNIEFYDDLATMWSKHQQQNLGGVYAPIDQSAPFGPDYFFSKIVRPILFRGINAGVQNPFKVSQRIRDLFMNELGFDIQEKMLQRKHLGVYKHQAKRVRVQSLINIIVAAHEGMHAIDFDSSPSISAQVAALGKNHPIVQELTAIYLEFYPGAKNGAPLDTRIKEGMAVLIEHYCQNPIDIIKRYKLLVDTFIDPAGIYYSPKTKILIEGIESIIKDYSSLNPGSAKTLTRVSEVANEGNKAWFKGTGRGATRRALSRMKFFLFNTLEPARFIDAMAGVNYTDDSFEVYASARRRVYGIIDPWIHGKSPAIIYMGNGNYRSVGNLSTAKMLENLSDHEIGVLNAYLIDRRALDDFRLMNEAANNATIALHEYDTFKEWFDNWVTTLPADSTTWTPLQRTQYDNHNTKLKALYADFTAKRFEFVRLESIVTSNKFDLVNSQATIKEVEIQPDDTDKERASKQRIQKAVEIYDDINQAMLDYAYNGGLIEFEKYKEWKANKAYASFQRHVTDDMNADNSARFPVSKEIDAFRKRHGSNLELLAPVFSQLSHISQVITKVHDNIMWQQLEKLAAKDPSIGRLFEQVRPTYRIEGNRIVAKESRDNSFVRVKHNGKDAWYKLHPELLAMRESFSESGHDFGPYFGKFLTALGDVGRFSSRMITTAYIYFPLINMPMDIPSKFTNAPAGGKGWYRLQKFYPTSASGASVVATNALTEGLINQISHVVFGHKVDWDRVSDAITTSMPVGMQNTLSPVLNKLTKTSTLYDKYLAMGARAATMSSSHMTPSQKLTHIKTINASVWRKLITFGPGYTARLKESAEEVISIAEIPSNTSEYLLRFETFKQAKANGDSDLLAMFKAEQATVAFVQHGANPVVAGLMRSIVFANAGLQVFYRYGSSWAHNPRRMAVVHSLFLSASILIIKSLLQLSDEDKMVLDKMSLEEWGRYLTFKSPFAKTYTPDEKKKLKSELSEEEYRKEVLSHDFIRIRVPDQLGFSNMMVWYAMRNAKQVGDTTLIGDFERAATALSDPEFFNASTNLLIPNVINPVIPVFDKNWKVDIGNSAARGFNLLPTIAKTSLESGLGIRTYPRLAPIVPMYLQNVEEIDQFDKYTSTMAKNMAKLVGGSPMQHDHFIRGSMGRAWQLMPVIGQNKETKNPLIYSGRDREFRGAYYNTFYESLHTNEKSKNSLMREVPDDIHIAIIKNYVATLKDNVKPITFEELQKQFPAKSEDEIKTAIRRVNAYADWSVQKEVAKIIKELSDFNRTFDKLPENAEVALWKMILEATYEPRFSVNEISSIIKNDLVTPEFKTEVKNIVDTYKADMNQLIPIPEEQEQP